MPRTGTTCSPARSKRTAGFEKGFTYSVKPYRPKSGKNRQCIPKKADYVGDVLIDALVKGLHARRSVSGKQIVIGRSFSTRLDNNFWFYGGKKMKGNQEMLQNWPCQCTRERLGKLKRGDTTPRIRAWVWVEFCSQRCFLAQKSVLVFRRVWNINAS